MMKSAESKEGESAKPHLAWLSVLSQFDCPELPLKDTESANTQKTHHNKDISKRNTSFSSVDGIIQNDEEPNIAQNASNEINLSAISDRVLSSKTLKDNVFVSPKHSKRKIINSHFDHQVKRKFPGPAGLLTGNLEKNSDENYCHIELLSQDIEFSQNNLRRDLFESPLWFRLLDNIRSWDICNTDPIKTIKEQALNGNLWKQKAQTVVAFVETVDRSVTDPLIILRDSTGTIKCTLHRDAWSTFSPYIISEYCALVLWKPTVLTTGSAFKKHYLNITLSNIYAIYSSAVLKDEDIVLPDGYLKVYEGDFTVIKIENVPQSLGTKSAADNESVNEASELLDGLDDVFSDELF
ncbi:uncharacterized protein LOC113239078 [Hyposmocoma kahamanoa]|uniref:uncharacterized protein LOC113239078 n=1 Tax=Hyposmocoma kahamanoa TaxID=1477025 RepID=UPI000E6D99DD|nr:uncharacterized protein LOC113239078 [Hyposmocoma kahamanoa]